MHPSVMRHLLGTGALVLLLAVLGLACGGPAGDVVPSSPAAQATSVRRTAVAEVQRIIANNSTPTPQPAATSTPTPTCRDAIWWTEARSHVGESRTVQGIIVGARVLPDGSALLEVGQPYPDPTGMAVLLPSADGASLSGRTVCVAGRIGLAEGRPTLQVRDAAAIQVVN